MEFSPFWVDQLGSWLGQTGFWDDEIVMFDMFGRRHILGDIAIFPSAVPYLINKTYFI